MSQTSSRRFHLVIAAIDRLTDLGSLVAALSLLAILGLIMAEIVARNLLGMSFDFTWDLSGYLMGACFMLACAGAMRGGIHVRVTAIPEMLPRRAARLLDFAACLVGLVICVTLSRAFIELAWLSGSRGTMSATTFRMPLVYPQAVLAFGAVLMTLQCLAQLLRLSRGEKLALAEGID
ncbi:MAG TPA: TRAP transporter small permease [Paenirhodobacter sp.]